MKVVPKLTSLAEYLVLLSRIGLSHNKGASPTMAAHNLSGTACATHQGLPLRQNAILPSRLIATRSLRILRKPV